MGITKRHHLGLYNKVYDNKQRRKRKKIIHLQARVVRTGAIFQAIVWQTLIAKYRSIVTNREKRCRFRSNKNTAVEFQYYKTTVKIQYKQKDICRIS